MSLAIKPHTVTVVPFGQPADVTTKLAANPVATGAGQNVTGYLEAMKTGETFDLIGIDLKSPARLFIEVADASKFSPQAQVTKGANKYAVVGEVEIHDAGDVTDHAIVYLDGLTYPK